MESSITITIISTIATIVVAIWMFFKNRDVKLHRAHKLLLTWIPVAYQAVNEISRATKNKVDDKIALFLRKLDECMRASSGKGLNKNQKQAAKSVAQAMHFKDKARKGK